MQKLFYINLIFTFVSAIPIDHTPKDYTNFKVIRVLPKNVDEINFLVQFQKDFYDLDFWLEPRAVNIPVEISVPPNQYTNVLEQFKINKIDVTTIIDNLQSIVDQEKLDILQRKQKNLNSGSKLFALDQYQQYDDIVSFIQSLADTYPNIASTYQIGTSTENRTIWGIKIGSPGTNKKAFWIDGGIHAREWLAPASALYIINTLVTNYSNDPNVKSLVDNIDWFIAPCVNPDGYEYTWNTDRYWRKTRSKNVRCYGVDANRNWNFHWGESGSSPDPCSDTFEGPEAFSDPEPLAMANMIYSLKNSLKAMITLHTYGQLWLVPYGYAYNTYPPDYQQLLDVAQQGEAALQKVHGSKYTVENSAQLYPASGASDDWSKGVALIKFVYTIELRPANGIGNSGFNPPATEIIPTGEELWAGIQVVAQNVLEL